MSIEYDAYLKSHKEGVAKAFDWFKENLPDVVEGLSGFSHDLSKNDPDEYVAYDKYFYGGNKSYQVVQDFNKAWLLHIHRNPHHWQYWILVHDDPTPDTILDMDYKYIVEMICDWWSFSFRSGDLNEIFSWYDAHKEHIRFSKKTRKTVEDILKKMKSKMEVISHEARHA